MNKNTQVLVLVMSLFFAQSAFADGYLRFGGSYSTTKEGPESSTSDQSTTLLDIGGGLVSQSGWTVGALYATKKVKSGSFTLDRTGIGPTLGWISRKDFGFYILGTYFLELERSDDLEGSGYQIDLGYKMSLGRIAFAPQLSYRDLKYDKRNGQSLGLNYVDKGIDPYFVFLFQF